MKVVVWSLYIGHEHGSERHTFPSEEAAQRHLAGYCREHWENVFGDHADVDPHRIADGEIIDLFFGHRGHDEHRSGIERHEMEMRSETGTAVKSAFSAVEKALGAMKTPPTSTRARRRVEDALAALGSAIHDTARSGRA